MNGEGVFKRLQRDLIRRRSVFAKSNSLELEMFCWQCRDEVKEREFTASYGFNGLKNNK